MYGVVYYLAHFQAERELTTGDGWYNMRAPEMTTELKGDLKALKMRAAMDPKRFYKKNDRDGFPKYFQVRVQLLSALPRWRCLWPGFPDVD